MVPLKFEGPFHFDEIQTNGKIEKDGESFDLAVRGIYIWGFMYKYDKNGIAAPVNFSDSKKSFNSDIMKFIPYYVGKSEKNIFGERMKKHHDVRNENGFKKCDADKYIRFSHEFMTEFFKCKDFPIRTGTKTPTKKLNKLNEIFPNAIIYHNNQKVLEKIYPNLEIVPYNNNYPIRLQKINGNNIPDTLEDIVDNMKNFWFCFAPLLEKSEILKIYETTVYYSLKGKTISMVQDFKKVNLEISITSNQNLDIFNKDIENNNRIKPDDNFPGY